MDAWEVFIKDHHEGYISWAEFERNQAQLARNAYGKAGDTKSGRGGRALLAGLRRAAHAAHAAHAGLAWPLPDDLDDAALEARRYPPPATSAKDRRALPDWPTIHRELRKGVTLQMLWQERRDAHADTPVIRDLVPDLRKFFAHYHAMQPQLQSTPPVNGKEALQSPAERKKLDGLYECILCACCSTGCPSYWWNEDSFPGPAALLQAHRWVQDSRDEGINDRLDIVEKPQGIYGCRQIQNCSKVCPMGLNPAKAIAELRQLSARRRKPSDETGGAADVFRNGARGTSV